MHLNFQIVSQPTFTPYTGSNTGEAFIISGLCISRGNAGRVISFKLRLR